LVDLIYPINIGNKKLPINDQQLANSVVKEYPSKKRYKHNNAHRETERTVFFAHV
jgi:hypothetical protein